LSSSSSSALKATVERTTLIPPMKVADLATTSKDIYDENVQCTYG
jgi:hypothetical protein